MKILQWMQKRLNGSNGKKKPSSVSATSNINYMIHEPCKQEFSDWPQSLLAIGTFGTNNNLKEEDSAKAKTSAEDSPCFQDCVGKFTLNLQNELNRYLRGLDESSNSGAKQEEEEDNHSDLNLINERLNSEDSSLEGHEGGEKENDTFSSDGSNMKSVNFYQNNSVMYIRGKDRCLDKGKSGVGKKSLFLLLKKMFVCRSGFEPIPPFPKDPLSTESRMEKILKEILHKKIYPQSSSSTMIIKKYLENRPMPHSYYDEDDDEEEESEFTSDAGKGCKWVKTDDEYIVLEI